MEILVVLAIMTLLSLVSGIFFSASQDEISLRSAIETIHDNLQLSVSSILSENLDYTQMSFSLSYPAWYSHKDVYLLSDTQKISLANDLAVASYHPITPLDKGDLTIQWTAASDGSNTDFVVSSGKKEVVVLASASSPQVISPLNAFDSYSISLLHPEKKNKESSFMILFFSSANIDDKSGNDVLLSKIEVQDISGNWIEVQDIDVKLLSPFAQKKYYANGAEYRGARLTFTKNYREEMYEF